MDCFARGLRSAVKIVEDGLFDKHIKVGSFIFCWDQFNGDKNNNNNNNKPTISNAP